MAGLSLLALVMTVALGDPFGLAERLRESVFDRVIASSPRETDGSPVAVIDIDRAALDRIGSWPWPRETLAQVTQLANESRPSAIVFDMLLAEARNAHPAAQTGVAALASALKAAPAVLGAVLDPSQDAPSPEGPPLLLQGEAPEMSGLLIAAGLTAPVKLLRDSARGLGVLTLATSEGEPVRRAPLLAVGGGVLYGGLAIEALRVATGDGNLIIDGAARLLRVGQYAVPLGPDASIRLWPSSTAHRRARTVSVVDLLDDRSGVRARLSGKYLLIGASAPEAGGLRETAADPFTPTVQIQADAIEQLLDGRAPTRPARAKWIEAAAAIFLALAAIFGVVRWTPLRTASATLALAALWCLACYAVWRTQAWLIDPLWPTLAGLGAWQAASLAEFAQTRSRRLALERSFATRLPPEIVARLADNPDALKLAGEEREITALFTDIEGFTALTERLAATDLVALLDRYFDVVCGIVIQHGGMVDKIVGDAVHAFFNAPVDLSDHPNRAVDCAIAMRDAADRFRNAPENERFTLGRTRIGIETGRAVVGDVGAGRKLDYTAHGPAINLASRLEASNKIFKSTIAVGPRCAALATRYGFRELGEITPFDGARAVKVCEPVETQ
ncbi:MAG: adenylate/guanylate cyclase domain-containing protein [Beijerinckiaceae bacterium]